jgi:bidirectional [NiFe] hydrogenase diaphorase subunit
VTEPDTDLGGGTGPGGRERRARRRRAAGLIPEAPVRLSAHVCMAASCLSARSDEVLNSIVGGVTAAGLKDVAVKRVGCLGLCAAGPLVEVAETGRLFERVGPDTVDGVVGALADGDTTPVERLPFFSRQLRVVTENLGRVDPESLDDALAQGAYSALEQVLTSMTPAQVVDEITRSGLRGRGGAGYPTGLKWQTVAKAAGGQKFVICNADEGDPGAFMDRSVLESDPHRVLEGMAIAGYAVGADRGFIYCRAEYPLALARLKTAIRAAEQAGWLGKEIAESRFGFHVEVRVGAGAFVCGEETALIASLQGGRGTPVPRPPYPATSGLWSRPTLINNVETLSSVAPIVRRGSDWYSAIGTGRSRGTKVFALAGRVVNTGLVEVPMGISLREIVYDIGGGIPGGRPFKAVQTGGPSGGCLPESHLDMPVDYESLAEAGSIMGSGGMIVMDDTSCMVDVARYFMDFCRDESCGKCVPCRVGTTQLWMLLTAIAEGRGTMRDLAQLEELSAMVSATSLCGLGQTAPNPVFSTLRYFRSEYLSHIEDRSCPAGVCPIAPEVQSSEAVTR